MDNWNTSTLYYCPVLNFAQHNLDEGLDHQSIMKYASDFFPYEDVLGAKKLLYSNCFPDEPIWDPVLRIVHCWTSLLLFLAALQKILIFQSL